MILLLGTREFPCQTNFPKLQARKPPERPCGARTFRLHCEKNTAMLAFQMEYYDERHDPKRSP